jgi:hypothetical protein
MVTYVINKDGIPLMPTKRRGWVRKVLKRGEAKVVRREPFTIKLLYETGDVVQECTLGVDTGSVYMGCAVVIATQGQKPVFKTKTVYLKRHICKGEYQLYSDTAPYYRYRHEKERGIKKNTSKKYNFMC